MVWYGQVRCGRVYRFNSCKFNNKNIGGEKIGKKIKKLDMEEVHCPICMIPLERVEDEAICPKCKFTSPVLIVNHRIN